MSPSTNHYSHTNFIGVFQQYNHQHATLEHLEHLEHQQHPWDNDNSSWHISTHSNYYKHGPTNNKNSTPAASSYTTK